MDADGVVLAGACKSHRLHGCGGRIEHRTWLRPRGETSVGEEEAIRKSLPVRGDSGSSRCREQLQPGLPDQADTMRLRDARDRVRRCGIVLTAVIQRSVGLDVCDRHHRGEGRDLERHQRLDLIRRQSALFTPKPRPVVVPGMRTDLDAELAALQGGRDRDRRRARMYTASDVGAVNLRQDRVVGARTFAKVCVEVQLCDVSPCSSWMAWPTIGITACSDSAAPLALPGTLMMRVRSRTPPIERESAAIGVLFTPARLIASPMPGTS